MFLNSHVFVSDDIWTDLSVIQGGKRKRVRSDRAVVKVKEHSDQLKLYVPTDVAGLRSSYHAQLPAHLIRILGVNNQRAERQIYRILTEKVAQLPKIMEEEDIPDISWLEQLTVDRHSKSLLGASRVVGEGYGDSAPEIFPGIGLNSEQTSNEFEQAVNDIEYRRLLQRVVRQARTIPGFLESTDDTVFSMDNMHEALEEASLPLTIRQILGVQENEPLTFDANAKIGAAGELFVSLSRV
jgi:hypothetical protein